MKIKIHGKKPSYYSINITIEKASKLDGII